MDIEVAQALYTIRRLPGEQLPSIAVDLLASGVDTASVRALAGLARPTLRDAGELFERVLADLGLAPMSHERVAQVIAVDLAKRVLAGHLSPRAAAGHGASYCTDLGYPPILNPFLADDDDYDCHPDLKASIDAEVVTYAKKLLADNTQRAV